MEFDDRIQSKTKEESRNRHVDRTGEPRVKRERMDSDSEDFSQGFYKSCRANNNVVTEDLKSELKFDTYDNGEGSRSRFGSRADYGERNYLVSAKTTKKDTFFCNVCHVELNSVETRNTHSAGQRHMNNVKSMGYKFPESISKVRNSSPIRRKIVEKLSEKIKATKLPAVGLDRVKAFVPDSFEKDLEPYYECLACFTSGDANALFNHVLGKGHGEKILGYRASKHQLEKCKQNDKASTLIETIKGDLTYAWPSGKAPWAIEQGGRGIVPKGVRAKFGPLSTAGAKLKLPSLKYLGPVTSYNLPYNLHMTKTVLSKVCGHLQKHHNLQESKREEAMRDMEKFSELFIKILQPKEPQTVKHDNAMEVDDDNDFFQPPEM